jgi:hypothetical protein
MGLRRLEAVTSRPGAKPIEREPVAVAADVATDAEGSDGEGGSRRFERADGAEAESERKYVSP